MTTLGRWPRIFGALPLLLALSTQADPPTLAETPAPAVGSGAGTAQGGSAQAGGPIGEAQVPMAGPGPAADVSGAPGMPSAGSGPGAEPQRQPVGPKVRIERIDAFRARIGQILVDRKQRRFRVPGRVIWKEGPLEFLAVTKGSVKAYEGLIELDSGAVEFNVACLLIGLDSDWKRNPRHHFDPEPAQGKTAAVILHWVQDGKPQEMPANEIFTQEKGQEIGPVWVFTGSRVAGNRFMAEQDGTLIGFVHTPATIIEHREGIGLGDYGSVGIKPGLLPPAGGALEIEVRWMSRLEAGIPIPQAESKGAEEKIEGDNQPPAGPGPETGVRPTEGQASDMAPAQAPAAMAPAVGREGGLP